MGHAIALRPGRRHKSERVGHSHAFIAASLGVLVGGLGVSVASLAFDAVQSRVTIVSEALARPSPPSPLPARELSAEWRWQPKAVAYEDIFRAERSRRPDWIR
jgi:hypothetical protein